MKTTVNSYNIFRVPSEKIQSLKKELVNKGLEFTKSINIGKYTLSFYFSEVPPKSSVRWIELYKQFLPNKDQRSNQVYFGALVIERKKHFAYAVSLGTAHFYIAKYADSDFGLDLAERIATKEIREKYAKYFFNNKNQSVIKYRDENDIDDYESGEYFQHIKSATISEINWGKYASFGNSIELKLSIHPDGLTKLIDKIEVELKKPERINIPRVKKIKDKDEINKLDNLLKEALNNNSSNSLFSNLILSNKDFLVTENVEYFVYLLRKKSKSEKLSEFDIANLHSFAQTQKIDLGTHLDKIKIIVKPEYSQPRNEPLKHYIDFISDSYECLIEGKWHRFNQTYIHHLNDYINKIKLKPYNKQHDIKKSDIENDFIELRGKEGYINKHRFFIKIDKRYPVELLDLYKDGCLYFVKIGSFQKLNYVIDQAVNTLQLLKNNLANVIVDNKIVKPKHNCLWIIISERTKPITKLSEINSLIFKWKLADWIRLSKSLKIEPIININYQK